MVVSIAKAFSADYYLEGGGVGDGKEDAKGAESYYLDAVAGGEEQGRWAGSGAAQLGLAGEVVPDEMRRVFGEFVNPKTGLPIGNRPAKRTPVAERLAAALEAEPDALPERVEAIRTRIESTDRQSVIGWDITFSVPKSVTVAHTASHRAELAAIRSGDVDRATRFGAIREGIEGAIHAADLAMVDYAESLATARTGGSGGAPTQWVHAPGLTAARFFQTTSRNIDPQLHVHTVILNRAMCADGKVRALDGADLLDQQHALGAVADRTLSEHLSRLGFEVTLRPDQMARELAVVPTAVSDLFSSRSRQVTAKVADLAEAAEERLGRELTDHELYRLKQTATLATRAGKDQNGETRVELLERWWAETVAEVGMDLDAVADRIDRHLTERLATAEHPVRPEGRVDVATWSPAAVIEEAVAAIGEQQSAWNRADLILEIERRLPALGGLTGAQVIETLDRLADEALAGEHVRQLTGLDDLAQDAGRVAQLGGPLATLASDPYSRPSSWLYATRGTVLAEESLRRAAIDRGGHTLDAAAVNGWLDSYATTIGADQRAAVVGLAGSDARLAVLVGPAGTGKSYAAGTFAAAWHDLTAATGEPGRVIGLATSTVAANVLRDDGVTETPRNIDTWLGIQDRLAEGSDHPEHAAWRLSPRDVVLIDEASMVATADVHRIQQLAQDAGARVVLTGDPRQLGAVEAGGVMGLLDGHAETYTLADVRRFATDWEADASLSLRDGDPTALAEYDRHGRLMAYEDQATTTEAAARAAVADRLDGRSVVVVTGTNDEAARLAGRIREQLVDLGLVDSAPDAPTVMLGRDGCTAGVGDLIACRRNDYTVGVTNRGQYLVTAVGQTGSLTVQSMDRSTGQPSAESIWIPAGYVAEDVQLGYASTAHAAQGMTVDAAHLVTNGDLDAAGLYVGLTRGRLRNTAHVAVAPPEGDLYEALSGADERPSARAVLVDSLARDASTRAALVEAELDAERLSSMPVLSGRLEATVRAACRERMNRHLDELVTAGSLTPEVRARLSADQGAEHLSRLLRAVEQSGGEPREALRDAVTGRRGLADADSVAQVLAHRITAGGALPTPSLDAATLAPADIAPAAADHIALLTKRIDARRDDLADRIATQQPAWAIAALGPLPADTAGTQVERADWVQRAGQVAAHREATGWTDPARAIGALPGLSGTEKRGSYVAAWEALGQPDTGIADAALTDGQLRVRVRAAESELAWAPPHADAALRAAEQAAEQARQDAALARAEAEHATQLGRHQHASDLLAGAAGFDQVTAERLAAAVALDRAATARREWTVAAAPTLDAGQRARAEADRRGLAIGDEPDRTTAEEWLAADRHARQADDEHRAITDTDVADHEHQAHEHQVVEPPASEPAEQGDRPQLWGGRVVIPEDITSHELEAMTAATAAVSAQIADRASQDSAADVSDGPDDYETGRRRRDAADHVSDQIAEVSAAAAESGAGYE